MQVSIILTPCTSREHHKLIFLHEKQTPHATTSPPIRQSHHHAHGVSICFKLLPHPPYFRTHCCNKANHGELAVDPFWRRHIKRACISKFGARLRHERKRMKGRLRWLWEWGWLLGLEVSGGGYSLEETASDLACEKAWLNLMSMEDGKKMGMDSVGMKMD